MKDSSPGSGMGVGGDKVGADGASTATELTTISSILSTLTPTAAERSAAEAEPKSPAAISAAWTDAMRIVARILMLLKVTVRVMSLGFTPAIKAARLERKIS